MQTIPAVQRVQALEGSIYKCHRCGENHQSNISRFRFLNCRACGKEVHIAKVCCSSRPKLNSRKPLKSSQLQRKGQGQTIHSVVKDSLPPDSEALVVASLSVFSEKTLNIYSSGLDLKPSDVSLRIYSGELLLVIEMLDVEITYGPQQATLLLIVV